MVTVFVFKSAVVESVVVLLQRNAPDVGVPCSSPIHCDDCVLLRHWLALWACQQPTLIKWRCGDSSC